MDLWQEEYDIHAQRQPDMPLQPNNAAFEALDTAGLLNITTARDDGRMVGYVLSMVYPHMHHSGCVCGFVDTFYLTPRARRGRVGIRMIKASIRNMKDAGAMRVFFNTDAANDTAAIFTHLGFTKTAETYALWTGDR